MPFTNSYLQSCIDYIFDVLASEALLLMEERLFLPTNQGELSQNEKQKDSRSSWHHIKSPLKSASPGFLITWPKYTSVWLKGISIFFSSVSTERVLEDTSEWCYHKDNLYVTWKAILKVTHFSWVPAMYIGISKRMHDTCWVFKKKIKMTGTKVPELSKNNLPRYRFLGELFHRNCLLWT